MKVLAVVLARGGSVRIPDKNLQHLGGVSLTALAALSAEMATCVSRVCVSTDSADIYESAREHSLKALDWVQRPEELSGEHGRIEDAARHALIEMEKRHREEYDYVVVLQAAVPVRPIGAINQLVKAVHEAKAGGGVTVVRRTHWQWRINVHPQGFAETWWDPTKYPRSQDAKGACVEEINAIQVTPRAVALRGERWASPLVMLEIPTWAGLDIDTPEDLEEARDRWPLVVERQQKLLAAHLEYPTHLVRHHLRELAGKRFYGPPATNFFKDQHIGVVLGNGPQLDRLSDPVWRALEAPGCITIGVNRICCSNVIREHRFYPNFHLIWDPPAAPAQMSDHEKLRVAGLMQLSGKTWRLGQQQVGMEHYPYDQLIPFHPSDEGTVEQGMRVRNNSAEGAVNLLWRMGLREIYLLGVEMNDSRHLKTFGTVDQGIWDQEACVQRAFEAWRLTQRNLPGLKLYCSCRTSRLVTEQVVPFKAIPGLEGVI